MDRLAEFNAIEIAQLLGGSLWKKPPKSLEFTRSAGNIEIHENGGEVNVYFEYLRGVDFQPPTGIQISEFTFSFSIPYTGCNEIEFAARLLFYLEKQRMELIYRIILLREKGRLNNSNPDWQPRLKGLRN
ncbi:MAG: hypothetical protein ACYTXF_33275 [Nostoc sp.]